MLIYLLRRIALMVPTLLGITIVVFGVMAASPGGIVPPGMAHGQDLKPEEKAALMEYYNRRYGLDKPAPVQYLMWLNNVSPIGFVLNKDHEIQHFSWTKGSDLGKSFKNDRSVGDLMKERLPITLLLNVITLPLVYIIAIAIGIKAATDRGGQFDVSSGLFMLALWSIPTMLAGVLLIGFFSNVQHWHWFPTAGLSERDAGGMTFLPSGLSMFSLLKILVLTSLGAVAGVTLSQWRKRSLRTVLGAATGLLLGLLMASSHPDFLWFNWLFLPVLLALLVGGMAYSDFILLRVGGLGVIGLGIGLSLALFTISEQYERGFLLDRIWHLILPIITLSYGSFAFLAKLTRTSVLENLKMDYARTARAKGVPEDEVLWRHVFRNSLLPLITVSAGILPGLLAGSVIVESIFSIDGMGKLAIEAVNNRDRELMLSITLISGFLTLIGYLVADVLYSLVDPRVTYD